MSCGCGGGEEYYPEVRLAVRFHSTNCHLFGFPATSLVKIEDDRLQALLDEIQAMRKFQT